MNDTARERLVAWHLAWPAHLGMAPEPFGIETDAHLCNGELWGQPCGRQHETGDWYAMRDCPQYPVWMSNEPPASDHERWWRRSSDGVLLYTAEPYAPVDEWPESPSDYAARVFETLGLHVAYGRRGYGHYAASALVYGDTPVPSMMIAVSLDADLARAAAACECLPSDLGVMD